MGPLHDVPGEATILPWNPAVCKGKPGTQGFWSLPQKPIEEFSGKLPGTQIA